MTEEYGGNEKDPEPEKLQRAALFGNVTPEITMRGESRPGHSIFDNVLWGALVRIHINPERSRSAAAAD